MNHKKTIGIYFVILVLQLILLSFISFYIVSKTNGDVVKEEPEAATCVSLSLGGDALVISSSSDSGVEIIEEEDEEMDKGQIMEISAYNLVESQCDSSPLIGAFGDNLMELMDKGIQVCASNAFPKGTKLQIQGFGECVVMDRMNSRYGNGYLDICMGMDIEQALSFGRKNLMVSIIN